MKSSKQKNRYKLASGGFQGGFEGSLFQMKILQLYLLRAYNKSLNFNVWTEDEKAGKFDDVLFSYTSENQTKLSFLQAKHKVKVMTFDLSTLFNDKNYDLLKYFHSFLSLEENFDINYQNQDLVDICIATNNKFPESKSDSTILSNSSHEKSCLSFERANHSIFYKEGQIHKFNSSKENENLEFLKTKFISIELAQLLFENNFKTVVLHRCKNFLSSNVWRTDGDSIKFTEKFLNSGHPEAEFLRCTFYQTVNDSVKNKSDRSIWEKLREFKFSKILVNEIHKFADDEDYIDSKIKIFTDKLLLITELNESKLDQSIKLEILKIVNDVNLLSDAYVHFEKSTKEWLLNSFEDKNVACNSRVKLSNDKLGEIFQPIVSKNILKLSQLEFLGFPTDLKLFLSPDSPHQAIIYEVAKGETFWGCVKLHRLYNQIIYIAMKDKNFNLQQIIDLIPLSSKEIVLVLECSEDSDLKTRQSFMEKVIKNYEAKIVIVCSSDMDFKFSEHHIGKVIDEELLCGQLTEDSLNKYLGKTINFQGSAVKLSELVEKSKIKKLAFKDLFDLKEIGAKPVEPEIYLPRKLFRKIHLKPEIMEAFRNKTFNDNIVFSESDFSLSFDGDGTVHLVQEIKKGEILWKKSSGPIKSLKAFVDENNPVITCDYDLKENESQTHIIQDLPGMGKSVFLQYLTSELKKHFPDRWIQKIELQAYFEEFEQFEEQSTGEKKLKDIQDFLVYLLLKLESSPISQTVFKNLLQSGKVILLLDGFDETGSTQKESVMTLIATFNKIFKGNRIYVSTRPEWADTLENRFFQFSYSFEPFSAEDQEQYILKLCKKDSTWSESVKQILRKLNNSLTDREKSITGIPLTTKLVADFLLTNSTLANRFSKMKALCQHMIFHCSSF